MSARFNLCIESGNAAFAEDPAAEISAILARVATAIDGGSTGGKARDTNGNTVGYWRLDATEDDAWGDE